MVATLKVLLAVAFLVLAWNEPADAQIFKRKTTCSTIYKRCLNYSAGYGPLEAKRCDGHRDECMKTGEWKSRAFEYRNVERK